MRTIAEIKESMIDYFVNDAAAAKAYGFEPGDDFKKHFSNVSIESILFYLFACAAWVLERLFAEHKSEIDACINSLTPHRPKWYRDKVLAFMYNYQLVSGTDAYDLTGLSEADIASAKIVKHAVATENRNTSILTIKVASGDSERCPLTSDELTALEAYIFDIKDAGVRVSLVSKEADIYNCDVDIYYNAMMHPDSVREDAENAIKKYITGLPFNGEYTNMALVDVLQDVAGVRIAELKNASRQEGDAQIAINARCVPSAGYFAPGAININMIAYEQV